MGKSRKRRGKAPREGGEPTECQRGQHSHCPHVPTSYAYLHLLPEAKRQMESGSGSRGKICTCDCHRDCPLAGQTSRGRWPAECTCNGTLRLTRSEGRRQKAEHQGGIPLTSLLREAATRSARKRAAREAVAKRSPGLTPEQLATVIDEEWTKQGLQPPDPAITRLMIDEIQDTPSATGQARREARLYRDLTGLPSRLRQATDGGLSGLLDSVGKTSGAYEIAAGSGFIELEIYPDAAEELERLAAEATFLPSTMTMTNVEVRIGQSGEIEAWSYPHDARASRSIGKVPDVGADRLRTLIGIAGRVNQPCVSRAFLVRPRSRWQVLLPRPLEPQALDRE